ncbi:MFS transporter, NNP family, nitrate/nitrite transporter [Flavobacterium sp. CF108]|uniref:MFS transporter n=1 Tax=unclassified Flavobacterium TaxID=196869 RepID=UPI0008B4197C|nr:MULTISPECIES: MFS transporter [unclassified Flavobacterium]SEN96845.1 MFS transporter, NNP family, nitrate/nitrite transporter [Flavobacterium sp. fv08]SHH31218.1 MFS transporter, NNP family, nitrate/nitrite transporter [Flavobacterium sp. CF108]
MSSLSQSHRILFLNTLAFTICFACWTLNGVLITYLTDKGIFNFTVVQIGWLLGIPILSGSIFRLPIGILTDKYGGKIVFSVLLLLCSIPLFLLPFASSFLSFALLSFFFGLVGTSFAVGIGYTSIWYPKEWQGRALGIFGMGNAGAAITTFIAPTLLNYLSEKDPINGWKMLPVIYAVMLVIIGILFIVFAKNKTNPGVSKTIPQLMSPLKNARVWRFGAYYFLVFGFFVAYSQWLLPNFMNVYSTTLVMGGMFATLFSLPSGVIRAFGGYLSDKFGARKVMYWVLGSSIVISFLLMFPKMEIYTAGPGVLAMNNGVVTEVSADKIIVNDKTHQINTKENSEVNSESVFPVKKSWQEIVVKQNQEVKKKELLAKGITQINFSANLWVYLVLVILIGISWGIGKAAVYKHIPEYFPNEVGVVGGMVGLIGGLGGFFGPIIFGYLLNYTGLWTSSWIFIFIVSVLCLLWMHRTIIKALRSKSPDFTREIEDK